MPKRRDVAPPTHPDVDTRERAYLGSGSTSAEGWSVASEFADLLKVLGVPPEAWRIGVRRVHKDLFFVEAIRQDTEED